MSKLKILQVVAALHIGGAERVVQNLCRKLDRDRFEVNVVCLKSMGNVGDGLRQEGFNVSLLMQADESAGRIQRIRNLATMINDMEIDCVHTHGHADLFTAAPALLKNSKTALVHTFHFGNYPHVPFRTRIFEFVFARMASQLVSVSHRQREAVSRTYWIDKNRIEPVWNGIGDFKIESDTSRLRRELGIREGSTIVGAVGTLIKQKGYEQFLSVVQILCDLYSDIDFVIVGFGPLENALKKEATRLGIERRIIFTGLRDDAPKIMSMFDIFVSPSLWEAMPIVLLEALAVGAPIVATDVGDNALVLEDGVNGFVVPVGDQNAMVDRIGRLYSSTRLREEVGRSNRALFLEKFTASAMVRNYETIYRRVCRK